MAKHKNTRVRIKTDNRRNDQNGNPTRSLRWTVAGRRETRSLGHCTLETAREAAADQEAALRLGVILSNGSVEKGLSVEEAAAVYLDHLAITANADWRRNEENRLAWVCAHLGGANLETLTLGHLRRYTGRRRKDRHPKSITPNNPDGKPYRRNGVYQELCSMRRAVYHCIDQGLLPGSFRWPTGNALSSWPNDAREARELTETEVRRLIVAALQMTWDSAMLNYGQQVAALIEVSAWVPARPSELHALRRKDLVRLVSHEQGELPRKAALLRFYKTKGGIGRGWRPVAEPGRLALIKQHHRSASRGADGLLFVKPSGKRWCSPGWSHCLKRVAREAGVEDVRPYDLRKFGVRAIHRTVTNLATLIKFTGHRNIATLTKHYLQSARGEAESLAGLVGWEKPPLRLVSGEGEES